MEGFETFQDLSTYFHELPIRHLIWEQIKKFQEHNFLFDIKYLSINIYFDTGWYLCLISVKISLTYTKTICLHARHKTRIKAK